MDKWTKVLGEVDKTVESLHFQIVIILFIFTGLYVWKKELVVFFLIIF